MERTMGADWDNTPSVELHCKCSKKIAGSVTVNCVFVREAWSLNPIHWVIITKIIQFSSFYWLFQSLLFIASELLICMNAHKKQT